MTSVNNIVHNDKAQLLIEQLLDIWWYWVFTFYFKNPYVKKNSDLLEIHAEIVMDEMIQLLGVCFKIKSEQGSGYLYKWNNIDHELIIVGAGWYMGFIIVFFSILGVFEIFYKILNKKVASFSISHSTVHSARLKLWVLLDLLINCYNRIQFWLFFFFLESCYCLFKKMNLKELAAHASRKMLEESLFYPKTKGSFFSEK